MNNNEFISGAEFESIMAGGGFISRPEAIRALGYDESLKLAKYPDGDNWAIGYGLQLNRGDTPSILKQSGVAEEDIPGIYSGEKSLTPEQATKAFKIAYSLAEKQASEKIPGFHEMPQEAKEVLANMTYQMGIGSIEEKTGVLGFTDSLRYAQQGDMASFKQALLDSEWAKTQTPSRAARVTAMLDPLITPGSVTAQEIQANPQESLKAIQAKEIADKQQVSTNASTPSEVAGPGEEFGIDVNPFDVPSRKMKELADASLAKNNKFAALAYEKRKEFSPFVTPRNFEEARIDNPGLTKEEWEYRVTKENLQQELFDTKEKQLATPQGIGDSFSDLGASTMTFLAALGGSVYGWANLNSNAKSWFIESLGLSDNPNLLKSLDESSQFFTDDGRTFTEHLADAKNYWGDKYSPHDKLAQQELDIEKKLFDMDRNIRIKKSMEEKGYSLLEATVKEDFVDNQINTFKDLGEKPDLLINTVLESAPNLLIGMSLGRAAAIGKARSLTAGMTGEGAAQFLASNAGKKAIALSAARTNMGFTAAQEGLSNGVDVKAQVLAIPLSEIAKLDEVKEMMKKNPGMTLEEARMNLSDEAFNTTAAISAVLSAVSSKVSGSGDFVGNLLNNVSTKSILKNSLLKGILAVTPSRTIGKTVQGAVTEGTEEYLQGISGSVASDIGLGVSIGGKDFKEAAGNIDIREALNQGIHGLLAGVYSGGPIGTAKGISEDVGRVVDVFKNRTPELDPESPKYDAVKAANYSMGQMRAEPGTEEHAAEINSLLRTHINDLGTKQAKATDQATSLREAGDEAGAKKAQAQADKYADQYREVFEKFNLVRERHLAAKQRKAFEKEVGPGIANALEVLRDRAADAPKATIAAYSILGSGGFEKLNTEGLRAIVDNEVLSPEIREAASRKLGVDTAKKEYDTLLESKDMQKVSDDVIYGGKGKLGLRQYDDAIRLSIMEQDKERTEKSLKNLQTFTAGMKDKADLLNKIWEAQANNDPAFKTLTEEYNKKFPSISGTPFNFAANHGYKMGNYGKFVERANAEAKLLEASLKANQALAAAQFGNELKAEEGTATVSPVGETVDATPKAEMPKDFIPAKIQQRINKAIAENENLGQLYKKFKGHDASQPYLSAIKRRLHDAHAAKQAGNDTTVQAETVVTPAKPILGPKAQESLDKAIAAGKGYKVIAAMKAQPEKYSAEKIAEAQRQVDAANAQAATGTADTAPEAQAGVGLEDATAAEEISSNSKGLLAALTNPTELAKKKGNLSESYPVTVRGTEYADAEAAYQALKNTATKDDNPQTNTYGLMVEILKSKLKQYPRLVTAITKKGGEAWLNKATHQPTRKNTVWETGGKNWFIKALTEAYLGEQATSTEGATVASEPVTRHPGINENFAYDGHIHNIAKIDMKSMLKTMSLGQIRDSLLAREDLDENTKAFLDAYIGYAIKIANKAREVILPDFRVGKKDAKYNSLPNTSMMKLLHNDNWEYPDSVYEAIGLAGVEWLATRGAKSFFNRASDIAEILQLSGEEDVTQDMVNVLTFSGIPRNHFMQSAGMDTLKILGVSFPADKAGRHDANSMAMNVGQAVLGAMVSNGDIIISKVNTSNLTDEAASAVGSESETTGTKFALFIKAKGEENQDGEMVLHSNLREMAKDYKYARNLKVLEEIYGDVREEENPTEEPPKAPGVKIKGTSQHASDKQRKIVEIDQNREYQVNDDVVTIISSMSPEYLHEIVGVESNLDKLHITERKSVEAKNRGYQRSLRTFFDFLDVLATREKKTFHLKHDIWSNLRVGIKSIINPQADKIHRELIGSKAWVAEIDPTNKAHMDLFRLAVMEGLDISVGKKSPQARDEDFEKILNKPEIKKAVRAIQIKLGLETSNVERTEKVERAMDKAIAAGVKTGGVNMHSLHALTALAQHDHAVRNGNKPFTTNLYREVDGITNGLILGLLQFSGAKSFNELATMLAPGGVYFNGKYKSYNEYISDKNNLDAYEGTAQGIYEYFKNENSELHRAVERLITQHKGLFDTETNRISKAARNLAKYPLMTIVYGAGQTKIIFNVARSVMLDTYKELAEMLTEYENIQKQISKTENVEEKNALVKAAENLEKIYAGHISNIEYIINASKGKYDPEYTFDKNILNAREFEIPKETQKFYEKSFKKTFGEALKQTIDDKYATFLENRSSFNKVIEASFNIYRKRLVEQVNALEKAEGRAITMKELGAIIDSLENISPIIRSYFSASLKEGMLFAKMGNSRRLITKVDGKDTEISYTMSSTNDLKDTGVFGIGAKPQIMKFANKIPVQGEEGITYSERFIAAPSEMALFAPGVAGGVITTHQMDAAIVMEVISRMDGLNNHDAFAGNILATNEFAQELNKQTLEVFKKYNFLQEAVALYQRIIPNLTEQELKEYGSYLRDVGMQLAETLEVTEPIREAVLNNIAYVNQYDAATPDGAFVASNKKEKDVAKERFNNRLENVLNTLANTKGTRSIPQFFEQLKYEGTEDKIWFHWWNPESPTAYDLWYTVSYNGIPEYYVHWVDSGKSTFSTKTGTLEITNAYGESKVWENISFEGKDPTEIIKFANKVVRDAYIQMKAKELGLSSEDQTILANVREAIAGSSKPVPIFEREPVAIIKLPSLESVNINGTVKQAAVVAIDGEPTYLVEFNGNSQKATIWGKEEDGSYISKWVGKVQGRNDVALVKTINELIQSDQETLGSGPVGIDPNDYTNAIGTPLNADNLLNTFDAMDSLGNVAEDPQHRNYLKGLMGGITDNLVKPLQVYLLRDRPDQNVGEFNFIKRIIGLQGAMKAGQQSLVSGLMMSMQEVFAHEVVHAITFAGINSSGPSARRLKRLFDIAKQHVTVEDFMNHDGSTFTDSNGMPISQGTPAWDAEYALAQERYNYIFNNTRSLKEKHKYLQNESIAERNPYLHEFMAIGLTNKNLKKKLSTIPVSAKELDVDNNNVFTRMVSTFEYMINAITGRIPRTASGKADEMLMALMYELADQEQKAESSVFASIDKVNSYVADKIDEWVNEPLKKGIQDKIINSNIRVVSDLAATVKALGNTTPEAIEKSLRLMLTRNDVRKDSFVYNIATDAMGPLDAHKKFHNFSRISKARIDAPRKQQIDTTTQHLLDKFSRVLKKHEKIAITRSGLMTDLPSIMKLPFNKKSKYTYSQNQIVDLLKDTNKLNAEIKALETELKNTNDPMVYNLYSGLIDNLASFMVDGVVVHDGDWATNAKTIAELKDIDIPGLKKPTDDLLANNRELIDTLVTLKALSRQQTESKDALVNLMVNENEGLINALSTYAVLQERALKDSFKGQEYIMQKGYVTELNSQYRNVEVATKAEGQKLLKYGYEEIKEIQHDPVNPNQERKFLYVSRVPQVNKLDTGIVSYSRNEHSGSDIVSGYIQNMDDNAHLKAEVDFKHIRAEKHKMMIAMANGKPVRARNSTLLSLRDGKGKIMSYRTVMSEAERRVYLDKNESFEHVLGAMAGQVVSARETPWVNREAVKLAKEDFDKNFSKDPGAYVWIHPDSSDVKIQELYNMLPDEMKQDIKDIFGKGGMYVHGAVFNRMFGQRRIGVASLRYMDTEGLKEMDLLKARVNNLLTFMFHNKYGLGLETVWTEGVQMVKDTIVIRSIEVLVFNIISNQLSLLLLGVNPLRALADQKEAYTEARAYQRINKELSILEQDMEINPVFGASAEAKAKQKRLKEELASNKLTPLFNAGVYQSITDDVYTLGNDSAVKNKFEEFADKGLSKLPEKAQYVINTGFMRHGTPIYEGLKEMTQLSDFMARYALHNHFMKQGMSFEESVEKIVEIFIDYDAFTDKRLQYANDVGLVMFTKYFIRNQRVIAYLAKERPASAAILIALQAATGVGLPDVFDGTFFNPPSLNNPLEVVDGFTEHPLYVIFKNLLYP